MAPIREDGLTVIPLGKVERHDLNWSGEISVLINDDPDFDDLNTLSAIEEAARNYWEGIPHYNESVWEYLTPSARVIAVEEC